jgi:hypothetical protein
LAGPGPNQPDEIEEPSPETFRVVYQEICKSHSAIADFRAKLLALLPIASGAAILASGSRFASPPWPLIPIGLFGVGVTFGLLIYELRGIEDCTMLRERAKLMEERLGLKRHESQFGQERGKLGFVDEIGAGLVVYITVIVGWSGLAVGALVTGLGSPRYWYWILGIAGALLYLALLVLAIRSRDKLVYRPFTCPDCTKKFAAKVKLDEHRARTHSVMSAGVAREV